MMWRFLAGAVSALLLASVGILWWTSRAQDESLVPPAPKARAAASMQPESTTDLPKASEKTREERRFGRYDKDRDGIVTRAEMMETRRKPFQRLDANGDGKLSFDEWAIATSDRFAKADGDRSGSLTATEFATTRREPAATPRCSC
jgi:hypothetical protein